MSRLSLDFPELTLDQLSGCELRRDALDAWLETLPLAHPLASQAQLLQLLSEFNQVRFTAPRRLEWLNLLAMPVNQVCLALDASSHQGEEGEAAQQLERELARGYKRCLNDLLEQRDLLPQKILGPALLTALFKALTHTGALIKRACQLSVSVPDHTWKELYLLYRLACQSKLHQRKAQAQAPCTCEEAYYQALLLGMIQAEDLRSDEVTQLYPLLAEWSRLLEVLPARAPEASYQILSSQGFKPLRHHTSYSVDSDQDFGLSTRQLGDEFNRLLETNSSPLSNRLTQHLQALLNENAERNAPRLDAAGSIELVLGFRSVHYHLSGRKPFEQMAAGGNLSVRKKKNPFLDEHQSDDPWASAHDSTENKSYGHIQLV